MPDVEPVGASPRWSLLRPDRPQTVRRLRRRESIARVNHNMGKPSRFNSRAFAALGLVFSGLGLPITGIANHAHQLDSMNITRHAWMAAHNSLGLLFVVFSVWHLVLNRRALFSHVRGLSVKIPRISREMIAAAAVVALVLFLFVGHVFHVH